MWYGKEIVHILNLIVETPNLRYHPTDSVIQLFDGGQIVVGTGIMEYEFTDGSTAFHGVPPPWEPFTLTINLATGATVFIDVSPEKPRTATLELTHCPYCNELKLLTARYCRYCGQDTKTDAE